jgi:hypothetical protein
MLRRPSCLKRLPLEGFPLTWNHASEKESLKFKVLEHVGVEKAGQLFRGMPWFTHGFSLDEYPIHAGRARSSGMNRYV